MRAPAPIDSGTTVGPYVVERQLAQGGMSVLYVARDADGGRVVLKMVSPEVATAATRTRLLREARALSLVDNPGIVRVHGTGEHNGMPWIAMDLVQGTDLKHVIAEQGHLPVEASLRYAIQATEALVAAHDAGVVHRDLKPSNVLLTPEGRIVLVDFGIAKRRADARDGDVLTSAREVLGTPAYLSPEQLDHGLADERSDIWALGCMLYEMVVGAPPFGRGGSATTAAILRDEPIFPAYVPAEVAHVVSACLRKNSFARIASPRELLALLRDTLGQPREDEVYTSQRPTSSTRPASGRSPSRSSMPPPGTESRSFLSSRPPSQVSRPAGPTPSNMARRSAPDEPAPTSVGRSRTTERPAPKASSPSLSKATAQSRPVAGVRPSAPSVPSSRAPVRLPSSAAARSTQTADASITPAMGSRHPSAPPRRQSTPSPSGVMRAASAPGRIKGTAIRAVIAWFAETYGEAAFDRVVERGWPGPKPRMRDPALGVMASGWYDTQLVGELLGLVEEVAAPSNRSEFANRIGAAIAKDNVVGVYRALFRLIATPALLEANAQRVWQTYSDEGTLTVRIPQAGALDATVRGWSHHHEGVCRIVAPMSEHALGMLGYASVTVERKTCVGQGAASCTFDGRWLV